MSQATLSERVMSAESPIRVAKLKGIFGFLLPNPMTALQLIRMSPDDIQAQIKADPEYAKAKKFKDTIELKDGVDYDWLWDYAFRLLP
jgi:L,D-peptidoglycan transpeptidase YkuD (ErfK/YbiS/YcfS/YnhG family)